MKGDRVPAHELVASMLPRPRGPLSDAVVTALAGGVSDRPLPGAAGADPLGEDLQLALYVCYELHYRGFDGVDPDWEWEPELLRLRRELERSFLAALRTAVPGGDGVAAELAELLVEPVEGHGISHYLRDKGEWWQLREYLIHRSIYHLKEADPHAWVIPRLQGQAKASLVAVEFDEFGGGRGDRMHSRLYVDLMAGTGLETGYLFYLDRVPAEMLAVVNMMSLFGLHRSLRGAMVGHFTAAEISTPPSAARLAQALERWGAGPECTLFYTEHIEADAVHEQIMRHDVIGSLLEQEPELASDVVFGIQATEFLESRFGDHVLDCWAAGRPSLLEDSRRTFRR
jgi:hypothetical protein